MRFKQYFFSLKSNIFFIITSKRKCLIEVYYDPILRKNFPDKRVRPKRREPCRHATCRQKSDPIHHRHNKQKEHSSKTHHSCTKHANMFIFNFLYLFVIFVILIFAPLFWSRESKPTKQTARVFRCKRQRQKPDFTLQRTICTQSIPTRQVQALFRAAVVLQAINI